MVKEFYHKQLMLHSQVIKISTVSKDPLLK